MTASQTATETPLHPSTFYARSEDSCIQQRAVVGQSDSTTTTDQKYTKGGVETETGQHANKLIESSRSWILQRATKGEISVLARALINTFASAGFWVGCLFWVINMVTYGNIVFASANFFFITTGIWWAIAAKTAFKVRYGRGLHVQAVEPVLAPGFVATPVAPNPVLEGPEIVRAFKSLTGFEIFGAACQVSGAIAFNCGCLTASWGDDWLPETYTFWSLGSALFLLQGIFSQFMCNSFWGPLLPLWPKYIKMRKAGVLEQKPCCKRLLCVHHCIPAAFLNSLGSFLFVLGSISLCYEQTALYGGWLYLFGSKCFVLANGGDSLAFLDQLALRYFRRGMVLQKTSSF